MVFSIPLVRFVRLVGAMFSTTNPLRSLCLALALIGGIARAEEALFTATPLTHGDFTLFELTVPPDALMEGCEIVGEVFTSPVFSDLDIEKGIVREEILEDIDEDGDGGDRG